MKDIMLSKNKTVNNIMFAGAKTIEEKKNLLMDLRFNGGAFQAQSAISHAINDVSFDYGANIEYLKKYLQNKIEGSSYFVKEADIVSKNLNTKAKIKGMKPVSKEQRNAIKASYELLRERLELLNNKMVQIFGIQSEATREEKADFHQELHALEKDILQNEGYSTEADSGIFAAISAKYDLMAIKQIYMNSGDPADYEQYRNNLEIYYTNKSEQLRAFRESSTKESILKTLEEKRKEYDKYSLTAMVSKEELLGKSHKELLVLYKSTINLIQAGTRFKSRENTKSNDIEEDIKKATTRIYSLRELTEMDNEEKVKNILDARRERGRDVSVLLLKNKKTGGDSKEMAQIKKSILSVESLLSKEDFDIGTDLEELRTGYKVAIENCRHYIKTKNPLTDRYELVSLNYTKLIDESKRVEWATRLIKDRNANSQKKSIEGVKIKDNKVKDGKAILEMAGRSIMSSEEFYDNNGSEDPGAALSLNYEDFFKAVGVKNRGVLCFQDGRMQILDNSWFKQTELYSLYKIKWGEDERPTVENAQMRKRLYELIKERVDSAIGADASEEDLEEKEEFLKNTEAMLNVAGITKACSLSRQDLANALAGTERICSRLKLRGQKPTDPEELKKYERQKSVRTKLKDFMDVEAIMDSVELRAKKLYGDSKKQQEEDEAWEKEKKEKQHKAVKRRIEKIISDGKKFKLKVPSLSDSQLDVLASSQAAQNQIFDHMDRLCTYISNLNGNKAFENGQVEAILSEKVMTKIALNIFGAVSAKTDEMRDLMYGDLDAYIKEIALNSISDKFEEGDVKKEDILKLEAPYLAVNGSLSLEDSVNEKRALSKKWDKKQVKVSKGTQELTELSDDLKRIRDLSNAAFMGGLSVTEAGELEELGRKVDAQLKKGDDIELVLSELENTRFYKGYYDAKKLSENGYYIKTTKKLAQIAINENKQEEHKEDKRAEKSRSFDLKMDKLSKKQQDIVRYLMRELPVSDFTKGQKEKAVKEMAQSLMDLRKYFMHFPANVSYSIPMNIAGEKVILIQNKDNRLALNINNETIYLDRGAAQYINHLEEDIISNTDVFGEDYARKYINKFSENLKDPEKDVSLGYKQRARGLCIRYLAKKTGKNDDLFVNLTTEKIAELSRGLLDGTRNKENVLADVININTNLKGQINSLEMMELVEGYEQQKASLKKVKIDYKLQPVNTSGPIWDNDEQLFVNFLADLISPADTTIADRYKEDKTGRLKAVLKEHRDVIMLMLLDDTLAQRVLKKLDLGMGGNPENAQGEDPSDFTGTLLKKLDSIKNSFDIKADNDVLYSVGVGPLKTEIKKDEVIELLRNRGKLKLEYGDHANVLSLGFGSFKLGVIDTLFNEKLNDKEVDDQIGDLNTAIEEGIASMETLLEGNLDSATKVLFGAGEEDKGLKQEAEEERNLKEKEEAYKQFFERDDTSKESIIRQIKEDIQNKKYDFEGINSRIAEKTADIRDTKEKNERIQELLDREAQKEYIRISRDRLNSMSGESVKGDSGQGNFIKTVFANYFKKTDRIAKHSMIASALRFSRPKEDLFKGLSQEEKESMTKEQKAALEKKADERYQAALLGGLLKGAGPLMHKMLQGLPTEGMPESIREAIEDTKSNLTPIPESIVKAQMANIIDRSKGKITDIEIIEPLGAASVAQTFKCRVKGPGLGKDGVLQVIKILRPNVQNYMQREREIMLDCAKLTDGEKAPNGEIIPKEGAMYTSYLGVLERIEEELDLSKEAVNAQKGARYERSFNTVKSVKVSSVIEPTTTVMAMDYVENSTTIVSFMRKIEKKERELLKGLVKEDSNGNFIIKANGEYDWAPTTPESYSKFIKLNEELNLIINDLVKKQHFVAQMAETWVSEGIFGDGFYHGDLHSGNIMIDDEKVTLIDFGNATSMDKDQISHVTKMVMSATAGHVGIFMENFHALLKNTKDSDYNRKKPALEKMLKKVFSMGNTQDVGTRIAVALMKAQEIGLELPPEINNFSNSQIRLQETINQMNSKIRSLRNIGKKWKTDESFKSIKDKNDQGTIKDFTAQYSNCDLYIGVVTDKEFGIETSVDNSLKSLSYSDGKAETLKTDILNMDMPAFRVKYKVEKDKDNKVQLPFNLVTKLNENKDAIGQALSNFNTNQKKVKYLDKDTGDFQKSLNKLEGMLQQSGQELIKGLGPAIYTAMANLDMPDYIKQYLNTLSSQAKMFLKDGISEDDLQRELDNIESSYRAVYEDYDNICEEFVKSLDEIIKKFNAVGFKIEGLEELYKDLGPANGNNPKGYDLVKALENLDKIIEKINELSDNQDMKDENALKELTDKIEEVKINENLSALEKQNQLEGLADEMIKLHPAVYKKNLLKDPGLDIVRAAMENSYYGTFMAKAVDAMVKDLKDAGNTELSENIRTSYDKFAQIRQSKEANADISDKAFDEAMADYLFYYCQGLHIRLTRLKKSVSAPVNSSSLQAFEDIMSKVVEDNLSSMLKLVGVTNAAKMKSGLSSAS